MCIDKSILGEEPAILHNLKNQFRERNLQEVAHLPPSTAFSLLDLSARVGVAQSEQKQKPIDGVPKIEL